jgi:hypothetical protein
LQTQLNNYYSAPVHPLQGMRHESDLVRREGYKLTIPNIELYFRQTQQYTNELSHTTYVLEFIGKIVQLRYMFRLIGPSSGATLTILYY